MAQERSSFIVLALVIVAGVGLFFLLGLGGASNALNNSALGTNALGRWLQANGIETVSANRRTGLAEKDVRLRILPLYDIDLDRWDDDFGETVQERRSDGTLSEQSQWVVSHKIDRTPTLLVLPKWTAGTLELNLLHKQLLVNEGSTTFPMYQVGLGGLQILPRDQKFVEENGITLYRPQIFDPNTVTENCRSYMTFGDGVLIAQCKPRSGPHPLFILSDPDFINNHGLALGNNAKTVIEVIQGLPMPADGQIFVDTSNAMILRSELDTNQPEEPRSAEELSRFLTYPFTLIYLSAALTFLILIWRGLFRFGPARRIATGEIAASKTASIEAKGHLLRLAGEDHALLNAYANDKMLRLARDVMGRQTRVDQPQFLKRLRRIAPETGPALETALAQLAQTGPDTPTADLTRLTDTFDETYRRLRDELGHVPRHG